MKRTVAKLAVCFSLSVTDEFITFSSVKIVVDNILLVQMIVVENLIR